MSGPAVAVEKPEFNSEASRQRVAKLLDAWATEHTQAAIELKALAKRVVWTDKLVGWKLFGQELAAMEV